LNSPPPKPDPTEYGAAWLRAMDAGDFEAAWRQTDALEAPRRNGGAREPHHLVWDGTPFEGRSVLVRCLHGLGDTLQFMRFVPQLASRASELHFLVQPLLLGLLEGAPGLGQVSNAWTDEPPEHEVEIEVMELAYALRCQADSIPPPLPYLRDRLHAPGALRTGSPSTLNVGLLWAASDWDASRSVPFDMLQSVLAIERVRFFSLQQGPAATDAAVTRYGLEPLSERTTRIEDAAAAMLGMDLVICVDGMPAHLAATLGRPTWVMLKHDADWRWMRTRSDTPWYASMRLFRQPHEGDWSSVAARIAAALGSEIKALCRSRA